LFNPRKDNNAKLNKKIISGVERCGKVLDRSADSPRKIGK
jgi:hypothetical protein